MGFPSDSTLSVLAVLVASAPVWLILLLAGFAAYSRRESRGRWHA